MNQTEFAGLLGLPPSLVTIWKQRGWVVMASAHEVDVEASKAKLMEKRGTLGRLGKARAKQASPWGKRPHCNINRAEERKDS